MRNEAVRTPFSEGIRVEAATVEYLRAKIASKRQEENRMLKENLAKLRKLERLQEEYFKKRKEAARRSTKAKMIFYWPNGVEFRTFDPYSPRQIGYSVYDLLNMIAVHGLPTSFEDRGC